MRSLFNALFLPPDPDPDEYPVPPPEHEGGEAEPQPAVEPAAEPAPIGEPPIPFDPAERLLNGRRAAALLDDPLLSAVIEAVGNKYRLAWENSARGDIEAQRVAHMSLAALKDVVGAIRAHLGSAKLFEHDLAAKRREQQGRKHPY